MKYTYATLLPQNSSGPNSTTNLSADLSCLFPCELQSDQLLITHCYYTIQCSVCAMFVFRAGHNVPLDCIHRCVPPQNHFFLHMFLLVIIGDFPMYVPSLSTFTKLLHNSAQSKLKVQPFSFFSSLSFAQMEVKTK